MLYVCRRWTAIVATKSEAHDVSSAALQLIVEKLRRDRRRAQMEEAILQVFEVLPRRSWEPARGAEAVRRTAVYAVVAKALGVLIPTEGFFADVSAVCVSLGAVPTKPFNHRQFAFMRPKQMAGAKAALGRLTPAQLEQVRKDWYRRAQEAGHHEIERPDGRLVDGGRWLGEERNAHRAAINGAHFESAQDLYWRLDRDLRVWELYAIDGASVRDIVAKLGLKRDMVHRIVTRLKTMMGGQPPPDEDDDDAEEDD